MNKARQKLISGLYRPANKLHLMSESREDRIGTAEINEVLTATRKVVKDLEKLLEMTK